jgi:hypothetical protein
MFELTGRITSVTFDYLTGKPMVTLELNERETALSMVDSLKTLEKLSVTLGKFRKKRSLDANAYFHLLANKIAVKMNMSDDEAKKWLVKSYGTLARDEDGNLIGAMLPSGVDVERFYPYARDYKTEIRDGKEFTCYLFYERTRDLDTAQFARLLEGTITEAKQLGIETKSREELDSILKQWGNKK